MVWLKIFGCALIIISGGVAASSFNKIDKDRISRLEALIEFLTFIRREIDYFCVPVKEIFLRADPRILSACGCNENVYDFNSFLNSLTPTPDEEIISVLTSFSRELGGSYREEQLKNCDLHIATLVKIKDKAYADAKKNKKLYTVLCFSAAAAIVILII